MAQEENDEDERKDEIMNGRKLKEETSEEKEEANEEREKKKWKRKKTEKDEKEEDIFRGSSERLIKQETIEGINGRENDDGINGKRIAGNGNSSSSIPTEEGKAMLSMNDGGGKRRRNGAVKKEENKSAMTSSPNYRQIGELNISSNLN
jgi:hypothetical protein